MCAMRVEDMCCPACRGDLRVQPEAALGVVCTTCQHEYPVVQGTGDFLPADDLDRSPSQRAMEATSIVSIYEGSWWRAR